MSLATPQLCSDVADGVTCRLTVGVRLFREPDAGKPPVRFDEREEETGLSQTGLRRRGENPANRHREATVTAPLLDSTSQNAAAAPVRQPQGYSYSMLPSDCPSRPWRDTPSPLKRLCPDSGGKPVFVGAEHAHVSQA